MSNCSLYCICSEESFMLMTTMEPAEQNKKKYKSINNIHAHSSGINLLFDWGGCFRDWCAPASSSMELFFQFPIFHLIFARIHGIFDIKKIPIPFDVQSTNSRPSNSCIANALCSSISNSPQTKEDCKEIIRNIVQKI